MKKQPNKRYYKNCKVKFTVSKRDQYGHFTFEGRKYEGCLVVVTEGKKGFTFYYSYGVQFFEVKKRMKSLKFTGVEIKSFEFEALKLRMECETIEAQKELIDYNKMCDKKQIDVENFPFIK